MRIILSTLLSIFSFGAFAQHNISGYVHFKEDSTALPGVNVNEKGTDNMVVTDVNGHFTITCSSSKVSLIFSFIGLKDVEIQASTDTNNNIVMELDPEKNEADWFLKNKLELGYYGEPFESHHGFIINYNLQSIGKVSLDINSNLKFWKDGTGNNYEVSVNKNLGAGIFPLPNSLFFSKKSVSYSRNKSNHEVTRGLFTYSMPMDFGIDFGVAYNELTFQNESDQNKQSDLSAVIGLAKIFSTLNWGVYSSLNHNSKYDFYEIGTYKGFYIEKFTSIIVMGKYYNYEGLDGVMLSIRFSLFNTQYYCCRSWGVYNEYLAPLK